MSLTSVTEADIRSVSLQLQREARDIVAIAARCICGNPIVVQTKPRLSDGTPFPTMYYLTLPAATAALSRLEAEGVMVELQGRLAADEDFAKQYLNAHEQYLAERAKLGDVPEIEGISAGGMPTRVKCLHALAGHALAAGPGVNLVGDAALELCSWKQNVCQCKPAIDVDVV